ncbi:hypothetical protein GCM10027280_41070 [Micromonospora polyrhachis]|uniref:DUF3558 domain-containing protein n=1 Tax=Micromonospora polyrhachis TaxID=1282883 RepID=A0A7W7WM47_9ACTN|nr:DUF3558 family protein [Micromonospora polyrhachis]MBB4956806.1 hypothetical protein [Micromonospora polyrhachis]
MADSSYLMKTMVTAALLLAAAAACTPTSGGAPTSDGAGAPGPAGATGPAASTSGPKVDACTLLTTAEVGPVIGPNGGGGPGDGVGESVCTWENPETYHSITVSIGRTGTAVGGNLPAQSDFGPTEPGPDGIRFGSGNVAEFVVGDRACQIQVVTSVTSESDRPTAIRLIGLIRSRV